MVNTLSTYQQALSGCRDLYDFIADWFILVDGDKISCIVGKYWQGKVTLNEDSDRGDV